jgi:hypothetical protein
MNTCKTCKHWGPMGIIGVGVTPIHPDFDFCDGIQFTDSPPKQNDVLYLPCDESVYHIETHKNFGCVSWESNGSS